MEPITLHFSSIPQARFRWTDCAIGRGEGQRTMWIARRQSIDYWAMLMDDVTAMKISIRRLSADVPMPEYKTVGACAFDLAVMEGATLAPGSRVTLPTGLVVEVPIGYVLILAPRGSNSKKGIRLANSIGIVDQDYCGPNDQLYLVLHNFGEETYTVEKGERIAQGMIMPIAKVEFVEKDAIGSVDRGGFGTTG